GQGLGPGQVVLDERHGARPRRCGLGAKRSSRGEGPGGGDPENRSHGAPFCGWRTRRTKEPGTIVRRGRGFSAGRVGVGPKGAAAGTTACVFSSRAIVRALDCVATVWTTP